MAKFTNIPRQHETKVVDFQRLDGGLNLWELDYRLPGNQSPEMKNLWWQEGVLQCRDGQVYVYGPERFTQENTVGETVVVDDPGWVDLGTGYACAPELFHGCMFFHIGDSLYYTVVDPAVTRFELEKLSGYSIPENRGTFFRYNEALYYKNAGSFACVEFTPNDSDPALGGRFTLRKAISVSYVPTILMNTDPTTGAGDTYQPENRLNHKKKVQYNASEKVELITKTGDGSTKEFDLGKTAAADFLTGLGSVYLGSTLVNPAVYSLDVTTGKVTFTVAPPADTIISFYLKLGVTVYQLPVKFDLDETELQTRSAQQTVGSDKTKTEFVINTTNVVHSVEYVKADDVEVTDYTATIVGRDITIKFSVAPTSSVYVSYKQYPTLDWVDTVTVDGVNLKEGVDYAVNAAEGQVVFKAPPPVHDPAKNNTVEIEYTKENVDAYNAILDCRYVEVYGGSNNMCIVMGGSTKQPNAFFWNGNSDVAMDPTYWPMPFYQLAGDAADAVTGFGKQYGTLIVLKEKSIGKASYNIETLDGRDAISMTYVEINDRIGCDLPWTIQLVENNVVFCNTTSGVHIVRDSTAALENNIECISRNVNGTELRPGLLAAVQSVDRDRVCCFDDDNRYWVCADGKVYLWDYLLSPWKDPSWFYFDGVPGIAYFRHVNRTYHLDARGRLTLFKRNFMDYEDRIEKVYQFPPQFFDTYDRLKDVLYCIFTVRSDTDSIVKIQYQSDYETHEDPWSILALSWRLSPRNLAYRCLSTQRFAHVAKRKPGCRHIRHFSMRLSNNERLQDLAILSAQIYFRYLGRDR